MSVLFLLPLLSACAGEFSTLDPAGPAAASVAWIWWAMFGFSAVVWIGLMALWVAAVKSKPGDKTAADMQSQQNRWVVWGGIALPLVSVTVLLAFGIPAGHSMLPLSGEQDDALHITVTGHQWWWEVEYQDSGVTLKNEVHIPTGTPVHVHLTSEDVIHSFWVPRLAGKVDMFPGRTNILRLEADSPGEYRGQCAEFCGIGHAHMQFIVTAHTPEAFEDWLAEATDDGR